MCDAKLAMQNRSWPGSLLGASVHVYLGAESLIREHGVFFDFFSFLFLLISCQAASVKQNGLLGDVAAWRGSCPVLEPLHCRIKDLANRLIQP